MAGFIVALDANVLYGIEITDLFATMATRRIFRPTGRPRPSTRSIATSLAVLTSSRR